MAVVSVATERVKNMEGHSKTFDSKLELRKCTRQKTTSVFWRLNCNPGDYNSRNASAQLSHNHLAHYVVLAITRSTGLTLLRTLLICTKDAVNLRVEKKRRLWTVCISGVKCHCLRWGEWGVRGTAFEALAMHKVSEEGHRQKQSFWSEAENVSRITIVWITADSMWQNEQFQPFAQPLLLQYPL